jgi:hypothetical protein
MMAKAINWPAHYRATILSEPLEVAYIALRLGRLYFENQFWVPDEVVDVRSGHLRVRRGQVKGELRCLKLQDLGPEDFKRLKPGLQTLEALIPFLQQNYGQPVSPQTEVTVVTYQNLPVDPEHLDPLPNN